MSISLKNDAGTFSTNINQSNPTANVNITLPTDSGTMALTKNVVGVGQTWQLVTRTSGVQYTNDTGKPIMLRVLVASPVNVSSYVTIAIDGVSMLLASTNNSSTAAGSTTDSIIIGTGKTYTLTDTNVTLRTTHELR